MGKFIEQVEQNDITLTPHIPGIAFRGFAGEADFTAMAAVINAANQADGEDYLANADEIRNNYEHLNRSDSSRDMIFVEHEGEVVGYGRCMWAEELNGDRLYIFFIHMHPDWRKDGIPEAMIGFLRERLMEIAAEHPQEGTKFFQTFGGDGKAWYEDIIRPLGFTPIRFSFMMTRPCSQPVEVSPLPDGIEVRQVGPDEYRKVFDAEAEAFRDHWGYVAPTEEDYERFISSPLFDPSLWKVAWAGDAVAGMVLNFLNQEENEAFNRKRGYTENISVRRPWRRQGVARSLLTQSVKMFQEMGMEETCLGVDTENPNGALQLYESVGYREIKREVLYRAPLRLA